MGKGSKWECFEGVLSTGLLIMILKWDMSRLLDRN